MQGYREEANIELWADSVIGYVSPLVFGSGDEISEDFRQPGVVGLIKETSPTFLRFGGIAAEYYDWEANDYNGVFYIDFFNDTIIQETLFFGTDSFLQMCERIDAEPLITVNFQIDNPSKAARWVEYCNGDTLTEMGRIRKERGHPEPYNVRYWSIGNEPDISGSSFDLGGGMIWTFYRHFGIPFDEWKPNDSSFVTKEKFSSLLNEYTDSMRTHSPIPINIFFCLAYDLSWIGPVVKPNQKKIDYLDIHYYPNFVIADKADSSMYRRWLWSIDSGSQWKPPFHDWLKEARDSIAKYQGLYNIETTILEYNSGIILVPDPLWWNYLDGLFIADMLGCLIEEKVPIAAIYSIYEGKPGEGTFPYFGMIRGDTLSRRMPSYVLQLYREHFGKEMIKAYSNREESGLKVYASRDSDGSLNLIVINKNLDTAFTTRVTHPGFLSSGKIHIWNITQDAPISAPYNGTSGIVDRGEVEGDSSGFDYTFPPASITAIKISRTLGIEEKKFPSILEIYPSIIKKEIIVESKNPIKSVKVTLYDITGKRVATLLEGEVAKKERIQLPPLISGVYFLRIKAEGIRKVEKVVIMQ